MALFINLAGRRFGMLTVLQRAPDYIDRSGRPHTMWRCSCDCGRTKAINASSLRGGRSKGCGCRQLVGANRNRVKHDHANRGAKTREYRAWAEMLRRCFDPGRKSFVDYGGRGITVCNKWRSDFAAFLNDVGPCPSGCSLERIDNDRHYEPNNVRWATRVEQMNNKRTTRYVTIDGRRMALADAARLRGIPYKLAALRLYRGWSPERALTPAAP